jgi:hypothetical protein
MNIFAFDDNPFIAATYACDKYSVKMVLETAQLLCTVAHSRGFDAPYKPTHRNHPATIWVAKSSANWNWLCEHGIGLGKEYTIRYEKTHKCEPIIKSLKERTFEIWGDNLASGHHSPFAQCMPEQYKQPNAVEAYRAYYRGEKREIARWSPPSTIPHWYF